LKAEYLHITVWGPFSKVDYLFMRVDDTFFTKYEKNLHAKHPEESPEKGG